MAQVWPPEPPLAHILSLAALLNLYANDLGCRTALQVAAPVFVCQAHPPRRSSRQEVEQIVFDVG